MTSKTANLGGFSTYHSTMTAEELRLILMQELERWSRMEYNEQEFAAVSDEIRSQLSYISTRLLDLLPTGMASPQKAVSDAFILLGTTVASAAMSIVLDQHKGTEDRFHALILYFSSVMITTRTRKEINFLLAEIARQDAERAAAAAAENEAKGAENGNPTIQ